MTLKNKLWEHLYYGHGYHKIADASVRVVNFKEKKDTVQADVIVSYDGEESHRQNGVEFQKSEILQ